jgi:hypothetical protein
MLNGWLLLFGGLVLGSCDQQKKPVAQAASPQPVSASAHKLVYLPTGPDPGVFDLLPVNGDTLRWSGNSGQNRVLSFARHERQLPTC